MAPAVGWYLYAFLFPAPLPPMRGLDGASPIRLLTYGDIGALTSHVPLADFGEGALQRNLQDPHWLEAKARHHESVVEAAMSSGPVLPMKFGTIFHEAARIQGLIARNAGAVRDALREFTGKEEWGVRGFVNGSVLRASTLQDEPSVLALAGAAAAAPPGQGFFLRKRAEALATARSRERVLALAGAAREAVGKAAIALNEQRSLLPSGPGDESVAVNLACLVARGEVARLLAAVDSWNQHHAGDGLRLVASGPWPPYHFVPRLEDHG